jgi:hypothetical protein
MEESNIALLQNQIKDTCSFLICATLLKDQEWACVFYLVGGWVGNSAYAMHSRFQAREKRGGTNTIQLMGDAVAIFILVYAYCVFYNVKVL